MEDEVLKHIESARAVKLAELRDLYQKAADTYRLMTKVKDEWRLSGLQESADITRERTIVIRKELEVLRKRFFEEHTRISRENPGPTKTPYE